MTNYIYLCLIVYIVGGNALSITLIGTKFKIGELLFLLLGVLMLPKTGLRKKTKSIKYLYYWTFLSLVLIIVNTFIYNFSIQQSFVAFMYLFRFIFTIFTAYLVSNYLKNRGKIIQSLELINVCYVIVCLIGFFQLIFYPVANDWYKLFRTIGVVWNGDPHINRLVSTDFDPNYLACCLLIGITINLYLWTKNKNKNKKILYFINLVVYVVSILLTKSRSGILGLGIIIVLYWCLSINLKKIKLKDVLILLGIIVVGGYLFLLSNISVFVRIRSVFRDPSALARFNSWEKSFDIIVNTNFLGIGYNYYGAYNGLIYGATQNNASAGVDSSLLMLLITTGVLGFIVYFMHFISAYRNVRNKCVKTLMLAAIVICNFNNLLFYSLFLMPFYFFYFGVVAEERKYSTSKVASPRLNNIAIISGDKNVCDTV